MMNGNQNNTPPALEPMPSLSPRIEAALAHGAEPQIPADFAAKVAARAVAHPTRRRLRTPQFGVAVAWTSVLLLSIALFVLAPHARPSLTNYRFDAELVLLAELAAVGWGIARGFGSRLSR